MIFREKKVETFKEEALCPECWGDMRLVDTFSWSSRLNTMYSYECPTCSYRDKSTEMYPRIIYREVP